MYLLSRPARGNPGDRFRLLTSVADGGLVGAGLGHDVLYAGLGPDGQECVIHLPKEGGVQFDLLDRVAAGRSAINLGSHARSLEDGQLMVAKGATVLGAHWAPGFNCRTFVDFAQSAVPR